MLITQNNGVFFLGGAHLSVSEMLKYDIVSYESGVCHMGSVHVLWFPPQSKDMHLGGGVGGGVG